MTHGSNDRYIDRRQVLRSFSRAAESYPRHDFLVREIDRRMLERLDYVRLDPHLVVDMGCGRGASLRALRQRYPNALAVGFDFVPAMLQGSHGETRGWQRFLPFLQSRSPLLAAGDANSIPLRASECELLWSNCVMHWFDDPLQALKEAHRVLAVGGLLMFSTFGPDTLKELRQAFDDGYAHTQRFIDMHDWGDMLVSCGFADPVMDMEMLTLTYESFDHLVAEIKASGGSCAMRDRRRGLAGKQVWQSARATYERLRSSEGRVPATFEIVYGHAWKAPAKTASDGRAIVRFQPKPKPE